jgi:hypothetical protein
VKWNLVSVYLETVLESVQDGCTVCAKHAIGSENRFGRTRWNSEVTRLKWMLVLVRSEIVLILTQDRCTVCIKRTRGLKIIFDTPDESTM